MPKTKGISVGRTSVLREIERELKMRKSFYARQISNGKMNRNTANAQYLRLERAAACLDKLTDEEFERIIDRTTPPTATNTLF